MLEKEANESDRICTFSQQVCCKFGGRKNLIEQKIVNFLYALQEKIPTLQEQTQTDQLLSLSQGSPKRM